MSSPWKRAIGVTAFLALVGSALVLVAPAETMTADQPVPGGYYSWFGGAGRGQGSSISVRVAKRGLSASVTWSVVPSAKSGCTTRFTRGGSPSSYPNQADGVKVTIQPDGSFHGALRKYSGVGTTKSYIAEARGQFVSGGESVNVSVRQKMVARQKAEPGMPGSAYSINCDGRWLKLRAPLEG